MWINQYLIDKYIYKYNLPSQVGKGKIFLKYNISYKNLQKNKVKYKLFVFIS